MTETRRVRQVLKSRATIEGAGVHLHRAIGMGPPEQYDPFLLLDDFRSDEPEEYLSGFPCHPHRGMETITYVLRGEVEHGDSLGNKGVITSGRLIGEPIAWHGPIVMSPQEELRVAFSELEQGTFIK